MPYVVGALGSRPAKKAFGRSGASAGISRREPRGRRHAVDTDTRDAACGTRDSLQVFDDLPWAPDPDACEACEAAVPYDM